MPDLQAVVQFRILAWCIWLQGKLGPYPSHQEVSEVIRWMDPFLSSLPWGKVYYNVKNARIPELYSMGPKCLGDR